ncbi:hypothetical protein [Paenibacillus massiliensis]|uniref:hypothetical protein n=1 Tax=Paenibacillus massiliensis TaxID=225917 RepID=UPI00046F1FF2|nr:hypothetical protein [Paenibacillus massiliensis]
MINFSINDIANGIIASLTVETMKQYWIPLKEKVTTYLKPKKAAPLLECIEHEPTETQYIKLITEKLRDTGIEKDQQIIELVNIILQSSGETYKKVNFVNSFNHNFQSQINIKM